MKALPTALQLILLESLFSLTFLSTLDYRVLSTSRLLSAHLFSWASKLRYSQTAHLIQDFSSLLYTDTLIPSLQVSSLAFFIPYKVCLPKHLWIKANSKLYSFSLLPYLPITKSPALLLMIAPFYYKHRMKTLNSCIALIFLLSIVTKHLPRLLWVTFPVWYFHCHPSIVSHLRHRKGDLDTLHTHMQALTSVPEAT